MHIQNVTRVGYPAAGHPHCFQINFVPISGTLGTAIRPNSFNIKGQVGSHHLCASILDV